MSHFNPRRFNRRRALELGGASLVFAPLIASMPVAFAAELPKLDENDAAAKALGYVHDAMTIDASVRGDESRSCANCRFYTEADAEWGPCNLFPGKAVAAAGWCKGWVAKA